MNFRAVVLWVHVAAGVVWIGASAGVVIAATALAQEPGEFEAFVKRSAIMVNLLGIGCACVLPATGLLNLAGVARTDPHAVNSEFLAIVAVKAGLFMLMAWALWRAIDLAQLTGEAEDGRQRRIVRAYEVVAGGGAVALLCGLWLAGIG